MNSDRENILIEGNLSLLSSLDVAIQRSGGNIPCWEDLATMNVKDFFGMIATNDIRFKYHRPPEAKKK